MIEPPKSIASAGFQILLQYDSDAIETVDGNYKPVVNWDFVLTYTRPSSGFGKLIEAFEPFDEFPSLPFSVTSLTATGFDLNAKHDADKEIFEKYQKRLFAPAMAGEVGMTFERFFSFSEFGLISKTEVELDSLLGSSDGSISVYHEENPIHWMPAIHISKVNSREAMERIFVGKVKEENRFRSANEKLVEIPNEHGRLFGVQESGNRKIPAGEAIKSSVMSGQYEHFLNDEWMIRADHDSLKKFLTATYEEPSELQTFDQLSRAAREASGQSDFFKIEYQSNNFYKVENKRSLDSIEATQIKKKHGIEANDISPEVWETLMSKPGEDGLRIKIESKEDADAAVKQLVLNAVHESFGTSVSLYSKEEFKMRIFGQVYSLVEE